MKKVFLGILALSLMSGAAFATGGGKKKAKKAKIECKKDCPKDCPKTGNCAEMKGCGGTCH